MKEHEEAVDLLPLLAAGQLARLEREALEAHLKECGRCRTDLALWEAVKREIHGADRDVAAPSGIAERALDRARRRQASPEAARRAWTLVRAQAPLVRRELFPASAALMALGALAAALAHKVAVFDLLAPMIAAASVTMIYGREQDPAAELALSTPTSPWKLLFARLTLVSGYNLLLAFAASAALWTVMPAGLLGSLVLGWLGPLTFLSALALVLSMWAGTTVALLISYVAWMLQWVLSGAAGEGPESWTSFVASYQGFWRNTVVQVGLAAALVVVGLWSAERAARPGRRAEAIG